MAMSAKTIYKLMTSGEWEAAQAKGAYRGSVHDKRDGYIHFSTAAQLAETARKYFSGVPHLVLLVVEVEALESPPSSCPLRGEGTPSQPLLPAPSPLAGEGWGKGVLLRWEPSRGGDLFPHLYVDLPLTAVRSAVPVPLDANGTPIIPQDLA